MLALAFWPSEMLVLELTCNFLFSQEQVRQEELLMRHNDVSYQPCHHPSSSLLLITVIRRFRFFNITLYLYVTSEGKPLIFTQTFIPTADEAEVRDQQSLFGLALDVGMYLLSQKSGLLWGMGQREGNSVATDPKSKKRDCRSQQKAK